MKTKKSNLRALTLIAALLSIGLVFTSCQKDPVTTEANADSASCLRFLQK